MGGRGAIVRKLNGCHFLVHPYIRFAKMNAASSVSVGKNHFWGVEYNKMSFSNRLKKIQYFTSQNMKNDALHLSTL